MLQTPNTITTTTTTATAWCWKEIFWNEFQSEFQPLRSCAPSFLPTNKVPGRTGWYLSTHDIASCILSKVSRRTRIVELLCWSAKGAESVVPARHFTFWNHSDRKWFQNVLASESTVGPELISASCFWLLRLAVITIKNPNLATALSDRLRTKGLFRPKCSSKFNRRFRNETSNRNPFSVERASRSHLHYQIRLPPPRRLQRPGAVDFSTRCLKRLAQQFD